MFRFGSNATPASSFDGQLEVKLRPRVLSTSPSSISNLLFPLSTSRTQQHRRWNRSRMLDRALDRVNVLGDNDSEVYGHTGCVNALSWAEDGNLLITAGDDTTVRLWKINTSNLEQGYPFVCSLVINTGHRANIFNAKMLPHSSRIVTAAGDMQIRVFDAKTALPAATPDSTETQYSQRLCTHILRCHHDSVKRIVTEDSPDMFLSVSEDGTVRQHDLRAPDHNCRAEACSAPLIDVGHKLFTMSLSALAPHQLVVAGQSPYGYLFDRRHLRRTIESDWGKIPEGGQGATICVRKFGRPSNRRPSMREHVTGSRMSQSNGHEVILSYNGDGVYLYSTKDDVASNDDISSPSTAIIPSNDDANESDESDSEIFRSGRYKTPPQDEHHHGAPIILPRSRYNGARNIATVKDVNFLGPDDRWIVSGSDDGNFFIWDKKTGKLHGIYEGDSTVVNVIEGHPHFPLLAVSGIDTTVKLFAPKLNGNSEFSRTADALRIIEKNGRPEPVVMGLGPNAFRMMTELTAGGARPLECTSQ